MIRGWLIGDRELVARLEAMPGKVNEGLARKVTALCLKLQGKVQDKLSGEVLKVKTGTLRRSITQKVEQTADAVTGIVGTNVLYAARHEYGFTGTETVKAHLRTITQAFGRPLKEGSKQIAVRAFDRKVNYPAHSFLRSALRDMEGEIKTELAQAVEEAIRA